jgi:group I intron endonuclease
VKAGLFLLVNTLLRTFTDIYKCMYYIYKFRNRVNEKVYIGRTDNFERRLVEHRASVKSGKGYALHDAIRKYGWENFDYGVIDQAETLQEVVAKELEHIVKHDSVRTGYNATLETNHGGNNWAGRKNTPEYNSFIETMKEINNQGKMHGKVHADDSIKKMKEKAKGRFTLPWYIERYGEQEGTEKYQARCQALKNRNYQKFKDPATGRFAKH